MSDAPLNWFHDEAENPPSGNAHLSKPYAGDRQLDQLYIHNAILRIWLPEPADLVMRQCTDELGVTTSKYLREFFVEYLYGKHELLRMKAERTGLYFEPLKIAEPDDYVSGLKFSKRARSEFIPEFGKNTAQLKLDLNEKIKADLQAQADKAGVPLGHFVREILISHLMGHTIWAERKPLWTAVEKQAADDWTNSDKD